MNASRRGALDPGLYNGHREPLTAGILGVLPGNLGYLRKCSVEI